MMSIISSLNSDFNKFMHQVTLLLDEGSFREYDMLKTHRCDEFDMQEEKYYGDGVITGHGLIHGRKVVPNGSFMLNPFEINICTR